MKWEVLSQLVLAAASVAQLNYTPPPGSPGFYHGNSTAAVTFDQHSAFLGTGAQAKRLFVFSGEVHPWRLPSGQNGGWRDVLQKMKAAGYNALSVYHHWGITEQKRGELSFEGHRDQAAFYQVAKEVGILVIARPGPYINAETTAGGFPGWSTNIAARARTNATEWTDAWTPYLTGAAKAIAPFQYPDGPIIAVQAENEFTPSTATMPNRSEQMVIIQDVLRKNGITKIPITHNDPGRNGFFATGVGRVDFYQWDEYPNGFDCSNPSKWSPVDSTLIAAHQRIDPELPWAAAEFQGGSFDPWGGSGYDACFQLLNEQFSNVFYKNNYASHVTWQSLYMTFGGTNWGNLAEPTVYTSYDYGAPIREDRSLSPKYTEIKLQALFLHAAPDFLEAEVVNNGTTFTNNPAVFTTLLSKLNGADFYVVRQSDNSVTTRTDATLSVNTTTGVKSLPLTLDGRESKVLVTKFPFGKNKTLDFSTAEIMTWVTIDQIDTLVLYALPSQAISASILGSNLGQPQVLGSSSIKINSTGSGIQISGNANGVSVIQTSTARIIVADKHTAGSFWNPRLLSSVNPYDVAPDIPSVLVTGPYLVRNATITGSTLALNGDLNATTTIDVFAPASVKSVAWNGASVSVQRSNIGSLRGTVNFGLSKSQVKLPNLTSASAWSCTDSLPEIQPTFDDSNWVVMNKTTTLRPPQFQPLVGKFVLYADEYGFHGGNTIYRGHFKGNNATGVHLSVQGGFNFGYSVWVNSKFLGSSQGTNQYSATPTDLTNVTFAFNASDLNTDDNVVTVFFDQTGLEEDFSGEDSYKTPRGIRGYQLQGGGDFDVWKVQGNLGGESGPDKVRGVLNEGGLFVERIGAHLPGFPATGWNSSCSPLSGISAAGIRAYRTTFNLTLPKGSDIPIALQIERTPSSSYRGVIFINGWQFGKFNSRDGPQTIFPLPEGILNPQGKNELLITVWSLDAQGAKVANLGLINTELIQSSKEASGVVTSPTFQQLRK